MLIREAKREDAPGIARVQSIPGIQPIKVLSLMRCLRRELMKTRKRNG